MHRQPHIVSSSSGKSGQLRRWSRVAGGALTALMLATTLTSCDEAEAEPLTVPDVVGLPGDEARDLLEDAGLEPDLVAEDGSVWNASNWEVESTEPAVGEEIEIEAEVTVHLIRPIEDEELEAELVVVPDVVGLPGDEAQEMLEGSQLKAEFTAEDGAVFMPSNWEVESTDPVADAEIEAKSAVTVYVIRPEEATEETEVEDQEPETDESPELVEESDDIAERLEAEALVQFDVDNFIDLLAQDYYDVSLPPYYAITEFESLNSSTVRVHVQEEMTDDEEEQMALWFFNMTCQEVPELETIVVRDIGGVDSNFYAGRYPSPTYC